MILHSVTKKKTEKLLLTLSKCFCSARQRMRDGSISLRCRSLCTQQAAATRSQLVRFVTRCRSLTLLPDRTKFIAIFSPAFLTSAPASALITLTIFVHDHHVYIIYIYISMYCCPVPDANPTFLRFASILCAFLWIWILTRSRWKDGTSTQLKIRLGHVSFIVVCAG